MKRSVWLKWRVSWKMLKFVAVAIAVKCNCVVENTFARTCSMEVGW